MKKKVAPPQVPSPPPPPARLPLLDVLENLSDEDLLDVIAKRKQARKAQALAANHTWLEHFHNLTTNVLDVLTPKHWNSCEADNTWENGFSNLDKGGPRCSRCALTELLQGKVVDSLGKDEVVELTLVFQVKSL